MDKLKVRLDKIFVLYEERIAVRNRIHKAELLLAGLICYGLGLATAAILIIL